MKVIRSREDKPSVQRTETVTGQMHAEQVINGGETALVTNVFFAPGSRTHWHRHDGGQVLLITAGKGWVVTAGGQAASVTAGDVVFCPPNEDHWHGAAKDSFVLHAAVTMGKTVWGDPVGDQQYAQVEG
jgi:quercetin dioxygenase-like cupin family protein